MYCLLMDNSHPKSSPDRQKKLNKLEIDIVATRSRLLRMIQQGGSSKLSYCTKVIDGLLDFIDYIRRLEDKSSLDIQKVMILCYGADAATYFEGSDSEFIGEVIKLLEIIHYQFKEDPHYLYDDYLKDNLNSFAVALKNIILATESTSNPQS